MTALFEMRIRVGGDPRGFPEFERLRKELAKLNHPARPDVDWAKVEQGCLALFEANGGDVQTACFYTLARGQRHGLDGITQGVVLLEALSGEWAHLWPPMQSVRVDLLEWLFEHLQLLLRSLAITAQNGPALIQLDAQLARLQSVLPSPLLALEALRYQVGNLVLRLERSVMPVETLPIRLMAPTLVTPIVTLPPPQVKPHRRHRALWLLIGTLLIAAFAGTAWRVWLADQASTPLMPEPIRLDSLSLFEAGSATLKPGSTKVLVNALVGIKAQPGWLIVIAGHTDATGTLERNLALSHARATAVRDWMQRMGDIADSCFAVQGLASSQPIASNESEVGRSTNRRVDIQLVPQPGACEASG